LTNEERQEENLILEKTFLLNNFKRAETLSMVREGNRKAKQLGGGQEKSMKNS